MAKNTVENIALRLRAVLEILAAQEPSDANRISRARVLAGALEKVPLEGKEAEELASGAVRGERALDTATSKLVKAGWITKESRSGWAITPEGRQALQDFPHTGNLIDALAGRPLAPATTLDPTSPAGVAHAETGQVVEDAVREAATVPSVPEEAHGSRQTIDRSEPTFPQPDAVAVVGDLGNALGAVDWDPANSDLQLNFDRSNELWRLTADLPAGQYEYKVALNGSWEENYGQDGHPDGTNMEIHHAGGPVTFLYDHATHTVITKTDVNS